MWSVKHFKPQPGPGEDATSMSILTKQMQTQAKKQQQDPLLTRMGMEKTFPQRRVDVVDGAVSIKDLKSKYPLLFCADEVSAWAS